MQTWLRRRLSECRAPRVKPESSGPWLGGIMDSRLSWARCFLHLSRAGVVCQGAVHRALSWWFPCPFWLFTHYKAFSGITMTAKTLWMPTMSNRKYNMVSTSQRTEGTSIEWVRMKLATSEKGKSFNQDSLALFQWGLSIIFIFRDNRETPDNEGS